MVSGEKLAQQRKGSAQFWHDKLLEPITRGVARLVALAKALHADGDVGHAEYLPAALCFIISRRCSTSFAAFLLYRVLELQNSKVQFNGCFCVTCLQIIIQDFGNQLTASLHE